MGNSEDLSKNENININPNEIIENDCYEEIDLKKINKIIEEEKNWNKNSIIYTLNAPELKLLENDNEDQNQNENEKSKEQEEVYNKVIEEQKNEDESEEIKNKENNELPQDNNIEINNEIKDNQKIENEKQDNENI